MPIHDKRPAHPTRRASTIVIAKMAFALAIGGATNASIAFDSKPSRAHQFNWNGSERFGRATGGEVSFPEKIVLSEDGSATGGDPLAAESLTDLVRVNGREATST